MTQVVAEDQVFAAIREATSVVFSTMLNIEVIPGVASEKVDPPPIDGVMAVLGVTGAWVGTGVFYCREKLALRLSSAMMLSEITALTGEVLDAIGELANMVIGNFKDLLEPLLGPLAMSIPTVVYGQNFLTHTTHQRHWLIVPFEVQGESFEIRICLTPK